MTHRHDAAFGVTDLHYRKTLGFRLFFQIRCHPLANRSAGFPECCGSTYNTTLHREQQKWTMFPTSSCSSCQNTGSLQHDIGPINQRVTLHATVRQPIDPTRWFPRVARLRWAGSVSDPRERLRQTSLA